MVPYHAPAWLPGGHAQTVYAALFAPRPRVDYERELWNTPDNDRIALDWVRPRDARTRTEGASSAPLVALFHGLEGSSRSPYALALMAEVARRGWRGLVVHFRSCGGEPNRLPRAYHSGDTAEADWILHRLKSVQAGTALYVVGVSLGGNVLLKWLGEQAAAACGIIDRAAAVSAPVDLMAAGSALGRGFNLVYARHFLRTMKQKSLAKLSNFPGLYDARSVSSAATLRVFDDLVTAPLHGFRDVNDYWTRASSKPWLRHIEVPTLMINARNDPFLPPEVLPARGEVGPSVVLEEPDGGGHVGFVSGPFPGNLLWLPRRLLDFFSAPQKSVTIDR